MEFRTVVIVGVGLIGGSLGLAIRRAYPETRVIGVSSRAAIADALEMGAITEGCAYEEIDTAVGDADLVFLCTPIHRIQGLMTVIAGSMKKGALITDVGSTKRVISGHAASVVPDGVHFIGGHPMTGSEKRGVSAGDPFLFQNAIYVLCPAVNVPDELTDSFTTYLQAVGASVIVMDAVLHDRIAAAVSHLPQLLAVGLVEMIGESDNAESPYLRLAAGGFRDMTRIASSPFAMWDDIYRTNCDAVRDTVDMFIERLTALRDRIGTPELGGDFEIASMTRGKIPKDTKGFMRPLYEVLVVVEDEPGVIATISGELANVGLNIKDIEVLKVREGEGGTLRLAFDREEDAARAVVILSKNDYTARMRT